MNKVFQQRYQAALASKGASDTAIYARVEAIINNLHLSGNLLDFGAGQGGLIKRIHTHNRFTITAVDIIECPLDFNGKVKWVVADLNEKIPLPDETFDLICAIEVIEHLENPRFVAREWFRLLRAGGKLIFTTPNNESWRSLISLWVRGHFVSFVDSCYPAHISALLRKDAERILKESGFVNIKVDFTHFGCIPKLTRLSWQRISFGLLKGLRCSDNLIVIANKRNEL